MVEQQQDWEYGLRTEGHGAGGQGTGPVVIGENGFDYRVSGENFGQLPDGCVYKEGTSVDVDSEDQVYVFNRGTIPMIVFDSSGNVVRTWGEGVFANPHGVTIAPDGTVFCVDNGDSTVEKIAKLRWPMTGDKNSQFRYETRNPTWAISFLPPPPSVRSTVS